VYNRRPPPHCGRTVPGPVLHEGDVVKVDAPAWNREQQQPQQNKSNNYDVAPRSREEEGSERRRARRRDGRVGITGHAAARTARSVYTQHQHQEPRVDTTAPPREASVEVCAGLHSEGCRGRCRRGWGTRDRDKVQPPGGGSSLSASDNIHWRAMCRLANPVHPTEARMLGA
jgi:hypothetical protein